MFDLNATDGSVRKKPAESPVPQGADPEASEEKTRDVLDGPKMVAMHQRMVDLYTVELDRQADNRAEQAVEEDFYDNIQWSEEDAAALKERGQLPLVYNVVSTSIDWVTGTEKRTRTDFKVLPRRKEDGQPAQRKSELLKYLADVNRESFDISRAFVDTVKVGIGWIEGGYDSDADEPLYVRYESWRNMLWDTAAIELDLADARYVFRTKWLDVDVAQAIFPKRANLIEMSADDSEDYRALDSYGDEPMDSTEMEIEGSGSRLHQSASHGYQRQRVRIIEGWIRVPLRVKKLQGGTFSGEIYDPSSPGHAESLASGEAEIKERLTMRMHVGIFTTGGMLWFSESPYRHDHFPFTPVWGYRRGRDGMPYGMMRRIKDLQVDVNKRASKALHILSTNKVIMDDDALPDDVSLEEFMEEVARPDAVIRVKQGKKIDLNAERELAPAHLDLMSRSIGMIQQSSGVTDELMGRSTNAKSGIAIQRRQDQGGMTTYIFFDNLILAKQVHGEKQLSNVEQFMSERKQFRITNQRGKPQYVDINDGLPDNDVVRSKADFMIDTQAYQASLRQAAAMELLDLMGKLGPVAPEVVIVMLDLLVESLDIPNREEIVKRIRKVTGQADPDADEDTPEQQARQAAEAEQQQIQKEAILADIRKKLASAIKDEAAAEQTLAKIVGDKVSSQKSALEAALAAISVPTSVDVADHILAESGFTSRSDQLRAAAQAAADEEAAQQQPMQQQPPQAQPQPQPQPPGLGQPAQQPPM